MPHSRSRRKPDTPAEVAAAVRFLRDAHTAGRRIARQLEQQGGYGTGRVQALADEMGTNEDTVRKMRQFADPDSGYTAEELNKLCELCEKHQRALGFTFVVKLVTIPRKSGQRAKLEREVFRKGWSISELVNAMRVRYGRRRAGGRKSALAATVKGIEAQVDGVCLQWERMVAQLRRRDADETGEPGLEALPPGIRFGIEYVGTAVEQLRQAIAKELESGRST